MLRVNGFVGHVRRNDMLSVLMFVGFAVAFQLMACVVLTLPLIMFDGEHVPFWALGSYLIHYAPLVLVMSVGLFLIGFGLHSDQVKNRVGYVVVDRRSHPRLVNIVEQLAITAGLPLPKVAVIASPARNAFACGHSRASATVVVTRGLMEALDDDELSAVIAHEITHIVNGDIRLMAAANIMMGIVIHSEKLNLIRLRDGQRGGCMPFAPAFLAFAIIGGMVAKAAVWLARVSRLLLSTSREYIADAEAVRLTHNPAALISALRKIEGRSAVAGADAGVDAMMIDGMVEGPYATHPSIAERIATLVSLSGEMAFAGGPRRDTRPVEDVIAHRPAGGFGRKGARAGAVPTVLPTPSPLLTPNLLARVRKGEEKSTFGFPDRQAAKSPSSLLLFVALTVVVSIAMSMIGGGGRF